MSHLDQLGMPTIHIGSHDILIENLSFMKYQRTLQKNKELIWLMDDK